MKLYSFLSIALISTSSHLHAAHTPEIPEGPGLEDVKKEITRVARDAGRSPIPTQSASGASQAGSVRTNASMVPAIEGFEIYTISPEEFKALRTVGAFVAEFTKLYQSYKTLCEIASVSSSGLSAFSGYMEAQIAELLDMRAEDFERPITNPTEKLARTRLAFGQLVSSYRQLKSELEASAATNEELTEKLREAEAAMSPERRKRNAVEQELGSQKDALEYAKGQVLVAKSELTETKAAVDAAKKAEAAAQAKVAELEAENKRLKDQAAAAASTREMSRRDSTHSVNGDPNTPLLNNKKKDDQGCPGCVVM